MGAIMIADLIQAAHRYGIRDGHNWLMMIHDDPKAEQLGEIRHTMIVKYKENLEFLLEQCELAHAQVDNDTRNNLFQCLVWLRGEIKELENL